MDGQPAWTLVLAIPLQGLPLPLKIDPHAVREGAHWRLNLIRANTLKSAGTQDILQSNLSAVYPAGQQVSPYHMTQFVLDGSGPRVALDPKTLPH